MRTQFIDESTNYFSFFITHSRQLGKAKYSCSYNSAKTVILSFQLLRHVTIASGGVLPKIHAELLQRKKGGRFATTPTNSPSVSTSFAKQSPPKTMAARKLPPKKAAISNYAKASAVKSKAAVKQAGKVWLNSSDRPVSDNPLS